ncbi:hypothetical protein [Frigidibacter oleivorans]|uniref:hypothetical protein n=1 Tax=Frigidibacter oleivorans TaxID=2487129 RepID=UPI000F8F7CDF|nr:hypothetical protein [Frigidibacter oleivorans]
MRDLYSNILPLVAYTAAVQSAAGQGAAIDLTDAAGAVFIVTTGAVAGSGDFGVKLQESDDGSTGWADVAADQVQGDAPATLAADSAYRLGYLGFKNHVRLALTKAGGTSIAAGAVAAIVPLDRPAA